MTGSTNRSDFFVGHEGMSPSTKRRTWAIAGLLLLATIALAFAAAKTQPRPGESLQPHRSGASFRGIYSAHPYPHLRYADEEGRPGTLLLVSSGKGGIDAAGLKEGACYDAQGTLLQRDRSRLMAGPSLVPVELLDTALKQKLQRNGDERRGEVTLQGEIVDSKCYFGAMRPGSGAAHKACAQMCISGGIPPVLVIRAQDGTEAHVLLCDRAEKPVNDLVLPLVAEPVEIRGELVERAGMLVLKFNADDMKRL